MTKVKQYFDDWDEFQDELLSERMEKERRRRLRRMKDPERDVSKGRKLNKRRFRSADME